MLISDPIHGVLSHQNPLTLLTLQIDILNYTCYNKQPFLMILSQ